MRRTQFWIVTTLALLGLGITAANIGLVLDNRAQQAEVAKRNQYVQQSLQLEQLYRELVRALAELGARHNDEQLRALLAKHGITVNPATNAAPAGGKK